MGAVLAFTMVGAGVYAASNWTVGLASASSGEARSASSANLTISAVASPAAGELLFPGATGDVVVTISNPNPYPVTISAVQLPANTSYATGYATSSLTTTQVGCLATTPSTVTWNFATSASGSIHVLTAPLTVGASGAPNNPLRVTLADGATMGTSAPLACANAFFSMPALAGIVATGGSAAATATPATDSWTS